MISNNGVGGIRLGIILVIGMLAHFAMSGDLRCFKYRCSDKDTTILSSVLTDFAPILAQFPTTSYCAKTEPDDPDSQCIQEGQDFSGCLAVITTLKILSQEFKLVYKNCTNVVDCYEQAYKVKMKNGDEPKCHIYTYDQLQGGQGSPGEEGDVNGFQKCAEGKGEDLTGGLGQAIGQPGSQAKKGQGRQGVGEVGIAQEIAKQTTLAFCICKGDMCSEQSRIDKAIKNKMEMGTTAKPKQNDAPGLLFSKGVFGVLVGAHFFRTFLQHII